MKTDKKQFNDSNKKMLFRPLLSLVIFFVVSTNLFSQTSDKYDEWEKKNKDWEEYFSSKINNLHYYEGIYKTTTYIKVYENNKTVLDSYDKYTRFIQPYTVIRHKNDNTYEVYKVSEAGSIKDGIISKNIDSKSFVFHQGTNADPYLNNPKVTYSKEGFVFKYELGSHAVLEFLREYTESFDEQTLRKSASNFDIIKKKEMKRIFPSESIVKKAKKRNKTRSGTGFLISNEGYLITNYHVIKDSKDIKVKGIGNKENNIYSAHTVISDKRNDIAILKINNFYKIQIEEIPYKIHNQISDVGENIFVLGYPLTNTMGEEIKLTNGIISSKSGYDGDISLYQISAPVNPGSSGGPLFDKKGNIIGIITAKHAQAENAGYAIKSSYLINLIGMMNSSPRIPEANNLSSKSLSEKVKALKKYVAIITVKE